MKASVFVIDGDASLLRYIARILTAQGFSVETCTSGAEALERLHNGYSPSLTLLGCNHSGINCVQLIEQMHQHDPRMAIVLMPYMDGYYELPASVQAGAQRLLQKPFVPEQLVDTVSQLVCPEDAPPRPEDVEIRVDNDTWLVYASACMREIQQQAALVAPVNLPVLILGESGTGKEVIARYIHALSRQAKNTFLKVNCAAVPSELLESELFGYEQGAFTGAGHSKPGKFKLCDNGTMFLDEIGEMHPSLQAKLLQVLQDGTFTPLGGRTTLKVKVRIMAATNIDMKAAISKRLFREDLYYRLNGFSFKLPALRERREDVPVLARHFLQRHAREMGLSDIPLSLSPRLLKACVRHTWPGNLRELESFIKRYLVLRDEQVMLEELSRDIAEQNNTVAEVTMDLLLRALRDAGGNRRAAAKTLNISYKVLLHRLREFGMDGASSNTYWVS